MGDSEHINESVETIDILIVSATEQLKKSKKRSHGHVILEYLQKKGNSINQQILSLSSKNGIILNKPSSGKNSCSIKPSIATDQIAATPAPLEHPSTPKCGSYGIEILYNGTTLCYQKVSGRLSLRKLYTK